jgi:hypothetical protein
MVQVCCHSPFLIQRCQARAGSRPGLVSENWETNTPNDRETNGDQKIHGKYMKPQFNIQDWKSKDRFLGYVQTNRFNSSRIRNLTPSVINIATEYTMCTFVGLIMHTCHMLIFPVPSLITKGESNHGNLTKKNGDVSWTIGFCQHTCGLYQQNEANINIE